MEPIGFAVIRKNYRHKNHIFDNYSLEISGKTIDVIEKNNSFLCLCKLGLIDIEKEDVVMFFPFKKIQGYIMPTDLDKTYPIETFDKMMIESLFLSNMMVNTKPNDPISQLPFLHKNYPIYWQRELNGDYYPNGIKAVNKYFNSL